MPEESRIEKQLKKMKAVLTESAEVIETEKPQSRIEKLLEEINGNIGTSSGGTPDWSVDDENADGYIANKPAIRTGAGIKSIIEESDENVASGNFSHSEGSHCTASGICCHAEGLRTLASNYYSHSEGDCCQSTGNSSHSEGSGAKAVGRESHAEGVNSVALGTCAHAEGEGTIAAGEHSHVSGKYNTEDTENKYAEIVGNGGPSVGQRSNARTLDWSGNEWLAGKLTVGAAPTEDMDVSTKKYVDDLVAELQKKIDALTL